MKKSLCILTVFCAPKTAAKLLFLFVKFAQLQKMTKNTVYTRFSPFLVCEYQFPQIDIMRNSVFVLRSFCPFDVFSASENYGNYNFHRRMNNFQFFGFSNLKNMDLGILREISPP